MKNLLYLVLTCTLFSSCIGENLDCSSSLYKVKNQLQEDVIVLYETPKLKFDKKNGIVIATGETKTIVANTYICEDTGEKIINGSAEGGFIATTNYVEDCHLVIFSLSGDTLGNFSATSSIYNRENWELSINDNYDVDCVLNLTVDLIESATR